MKYSMDQPKILWIKTEGFLKREMLVPKQLAKKTASVLIKLYPILMIKKLWHIIILDENTSRE